MDTPKYMRRSALTRDCDWVYYLLRHLPHLEETEERYTAHYVGLRLEEMPTIFGGFPGDSTSCHVFPEDLVEHFREFSEAHDGCVYNQSASSVLDWMESHEYLSAEERLMIELLLLQPVLNDD